MPNKEFLEQYPLYKKMKLQSLSWTTDGLDKATINMSCGICRSAQTFVMENQYWEFTNISNTVVHELVFRLKYICVHCGVFHRFFIVRFNHDPSWIMKVGQYPAWDIAGHPNIEKFLGEHADYYKKGLICESQGYGIGAFGYYRRIVEDIIDQLLDEVSALLSGAELRKYEEALKLTKTTRVTQEKIDLVKDLLPPILRPNDMNPLSVLHSSLSEGLHAQSDDECLESAAALREILVFLVDQVAASKESGRRFTDSMKKILDQRAKPPKPTV
jgi:hypothetical protein